MTGSELALAIVGAGPRTVGLLERIAANGELLEGRPLTIHVIDPHPPGAGQVWRQDQSPVLLMNSRAGEITMFTDSSSSCTGPVRPGPTLHEWSRTADAARLPDAGLAAEAGRLAADSFASRRLAGQYLRWCFRRAVSGLPGTARLFVHRATAVAMRRGTRHQILLSDGSCLDADLVILALGGIGGQADAGQRAHADFAPRAGGSYLPPAYPGDADLDRLPAGEPVIVAGLGLTFIDIMALVTEGRGGRFERDRAGRLRYLPAGREPVLHVGSRRGVPYLPKPGQRLAGLEPGKPRFCTASRIRDILGTSANPGPDLVTCLVRELTWAYYRELFSGHPGLTRCSWAAFADRYDALAITDPALWRLIEQTVPDPADRLDLNFLRPLAGLRFDDQQALNQLMRRRIGATVHRATSRRHSPNAALTLALVDVSGQLESLVSEQTAPARVAGLARLPVFTSFVASGPPPHRLEQLAALCEAGLVNFLGAGLAVGQDRERGLFAATSATLAVPVFARHFVEARLPDTDIRSAAFPLLAGLGRDGGRLRSDPATFQVLDASGRPVPRLLALGAFASGGALGSLSRPCRDEIFFRQNDAVARWLLREYGR